MKKTFIILGAAALILFQACQKEEAANGTAGDKQEVSANIILNAAIEGAAEEGTKTTLGTENDIQYALWSKTDAVRTFDENGRYATMEIEAKDDFKPSTKATFIAKSVPGDFGEPVCAFYPASEGFNLEYADNVISFNLPTTQSYKENSFADNTNVAVSKLTKGEDGKFKATFMNVCGYLKLQLKGDGFTVKKLILTGNNDEKLNGAFTVNVGEGTDFKAKSSGLPTDEEKILTLDCEDGVVLNPSNATSFIFIVPTGAFTKGFTLTVIDKNDENFFGCMYTGKTNEIKRSSIRQMSEASIKSSRVEYIETTGNAFILTGVNYSQNSKYDINYTAMCTSRTEDSSAAIAGWDAGGAVYLTPGWHIWDGLSHEGDWSAKDVKINVAMTIEAGSDSKTSADVTSAVGYTSFSRSHSSLSDYAIGSYPLGCMATTDAGPYRWFVNARFYNFKMTVDNVLVRDMIPAKDMSPGSNCGLYDKIHHRFYGNANNAGTIVCPAE